MIRGTLIWGLAVTVALMATVMLSFAVIIPWLGWTQNMGATAAIVQVPLWLFLLTPIVAGVTEEIIYRGYAIERLAFTTGRRWLGGAIASAASLDSLVLGRCPNDPCNFCCLDPDRALSVATRSTLLHLGAYAC
jgi:Type II CAAX prenyl endopeptidase Rce1-like